MAAPCKGPLFLALCLGKSIDWSCNLPLEAEPSLRSRICDPVRSVDTPLNLGVSRRAQATVAGTPLLTVEAGQVHQEDGPGATCLSRMQGSWEQFL